ncbi:MAG: hypothetical protein QOD69_116 [Solirubrobacteraceae bacterium]|jgi:hypothetical protein|nr:hypothetical protein [Solirubrobacteraceae bacterium]
MWELAPRALPSSMQLGRPAEPPEAAESPAPYSSHVGGTPASSRQSPAKWAWSA